MKMNIDQMLQNCVEQNSHNSKQKLLDDFYDKTMKQISLEIDEMSLIDMYFENEISYKDWQQYNNIVQKKKNRLFE